MQEASAVSAVPAGQIFPTMTPTDIWFLKALLSQVLKIMVHLSLHPLIDLPIEI